MEIREDAYDKGNITALPNQKLKTSAKTKKWQEECVTYFIENCTIKSSSHRKSMEEIDENTNLVNSEISVEFMKSAFDPLGLNDNEDNQNEILKQNNYNILKQPLNTLLGEELKRRSDLKAIVVNQDAINQKDLLFKQRVIDFLTNSTYGQLDPEQFKKDLEKIDKWRKYDLQSGHEVMANQILNYYLNNSELNVRKIFNNAFKNLMSVNEEIYSVYRDGNEASVKNVDSNKFYIYGLGENIFIDQAYAWVEFEYLHPNKIIEKFHDLKDSDIKKILNNHMEYLDKPKYDLIAGSIEGGTGDGFSAIAQNGRFITLNGGNQDVINVDGDIRVAHVFWLSLRKLGILNSPDEFGDMQEMFVDENWVIDEAKGETIKWIWVNEIWEGHQIGSDIFTEMGPCSTQMRSLSNPYKVTPPYVGCILKGKSLVDDLKPYQRDFNIWMHKLRTLWVQNIGKVAVIDVSRIPSHMSTDEWFFWLKNFKLVFENPFEESNKGQLSGHMQQSRREIDLSLANEINQAITMLNWIQNQMDLISGVSRQRQGDIAAYEGLGTSQQAITQSSHQTEILFDMHDYIKTRVFTVLLEMAKTLYVGKNEKRQYILDDLSNMILDIDGDVLNEADYGIQITNGSRLAEMERMLDLLSHAAMQNGTSTLSDVARLKMSTSPSEMLATLEYAEDKRFKQQQSQQDNQIKAQQEALIKQQELQQLQHEFELEKIKTEYEYKIQIEKMKLADKAQQDVFNQYYTDQNRDGVEDQVEIDKINIQKQMKEEEIRSNEKMQDKELKMKQELELKKLEVQERIAKYNKSKSIKNSLRY